MKGFDKIFWLILFSVFPIIFCYPQEQNYIFRHITTKDGLSHHETKCIMKDSRGFMWFGTVNGLNRYDGYNMKVYNHSYGDTSSLSDNRILSILETIDGKLLIGTVNGGLNILNVETEIFTHYRNDPENPNTISCDKINVIYRDTENITWIGTNTGLNKFHPDTRTFDVFNIEPNNEDDLRNQIQSLFCDSSGQLWVGTNDGLFKFDTKSERFLAVELIEELENRMSPYIIKSFCEFPKGSIWIGTNWGLFKYDSKDNIWSGPNTLNMRSLIEDIQFISHNDLAKAWISTHWGLWLYNLQSNTKTPIFSNPENNASLSNHATFDMYYDPLGLLWIITSKSGIDILDLRENPFKQQYIQTPSFPATARSFCENTTGNIWVGANTYGLLLLDHNHNLIKRIYSKFTDKSEYTGGRVTNIYEDSDKTLWISFANPKPGLFIYNSDKCMFQKVQTDPPRNLTQPQNIYDIVIYDIVEDDNRTKWVATKSGLYQIPGGNIKDAIMYKIEYAGISSSSVWDLFVSDLGNIWVASSGGLFKLRTNNNDSILIKEYKYFDDGQKSAYVSPRCVLKSQNGQVLVGTTINLCQVSENENTYHPVESNDVLLNANYIYSIVEDINNRLWMSTRKGLVRYDPEQKIKNATKLYGLSDGLPYIKNSRTILYQNKNGRIYVPSEYGTHNGFYFFDPAGVKDNIKVPSVVIVDFKVRNEPFKLDSSISFIKKIKLKYNQNYFSLELASLDYIDPQKNQYAYMLEGLDEDWISSENRRFANYTAVPPGHYIFRVKGSNNDGYWNEKGTSLVILILPPPWKTWWAYIIYGLIILGLFYVWRRYDLKRQRLRQELELEHVEAKKLKELDTMKSRFFANISHEFRTPLTLILGPLEKLRSKIAEKDSEEDLNMMQRNAIRLQNLINQLLSLSKLESGKMKLQASEENIVALVNGFLQSFESLAKQKDIDLNFKSAEGNIQLFIDKDKIEKILYNLLSNAFKFTGEGGEIVVEITPPSPPFRGGNQRTTFSPLEGGQRGVEIKISDTGRGIPPEKLEHIFNRFYQADDSYTKDLEGTGIGLALTKELVELHHGRITVESEFGKGSTFSLFFQTGKKHLNPDEILNDTEIQRRKEESSKPVIKLDDAKSSVSPEEPQNKNEFEKKEDKPYLLVVDDNTDLRTYIRGYLDKHYYISEAKDGEEGYNQATDNIPDLIISDVMMPKMDGYEFSRKLKTNELTSHIPLILLTAKAGLENKLEGLETGADDFICKPFNGDELLIRIKNLINLRNKLKEHYQKEYKTLSKEPKEKMPLMDRQFLDKAVSMVQKHISDSDLSVETFASEMGLSRVQLHRKLKAILDQSAGDFIRVIRLNKSVEMLNSGSGNISEIAYDVGFSSPSYFSECFRQQFGISPTEFQSQNKE